MALQVNPALLCWTMIPPVAIILAEDAPKKRRAAGVQYTELSRVSYAPSLEGVRSGESIRPLRLSLLPAS